MFGIAGTAELSTFCPGTGTWNRLQDNVLKPVPQPPLEPELDLNKASGTKLFWGRPCHVDAQHGPKQEAGVQGGGTAPLVGSGAKPQKPAMICTYYQLPRSQLRLITTNCTMENAILALS